MKIILSLMLAVSIGVPSALASEAAHIEQLDWSFKGITGTYDRASIQRGFQVYRQVCSACHSMDRVAYRNLMDLGYSEDQIKSLASETSVMDGPNDEGDMFERPARPSDYFPNPYANKAQARYTNNGALPPDLSLIAKARTGGADYLYALLTGYDEAPASVTMNEGMNYNKVYAGHQIAMAAPLSDGLVAYANANTPTTTEQYAYDVSNFLQWVAEPSLEAQKRVGLKVVLFLSILAIIMYYVKKRLWAGIKGKK